MDVLSKLKRLQHTEWPKSVLTFQTTVKLKVQNLYVPIIYTLMVKGILYLFIHFCLLELLKLAFTSISTFLTPAREWLAYCSTIINCN